MLLVIYLISLKNKVGLVGNRHVDNHISCYFPATRPYLIYVIEILLGDH